MFESVPETNQYWVRRIVTEGKQRAPTVDGCSNLHLRQASTDYKSDANNTLVRS